MNVNYLLYLLYDPLQQINDNLPLRTRQFFCWVANPFPIDQKVLLSGNVMPERRSWGRSESRKRLAFFPVFWLFRNDFVRWSWLLSCCKIILSCVFVLICFSVLGLIGLFAFNIGFILLCVFILGTANIQFIRRYGRMIRKSLFLMLFYALNYHNEMFYPPLLWYPAKMSSTILSSLLFTRKQTLASVYLNYILTNSDEIMTTLYIYIYLYL